MAVNINKETGVEQAVVSFTTSKLKIIHKLNQKEIISTVKKLGYNAVPFNEIKEEHSINKETSSENVFLVTAIVFWLVAYFLPQYAYYFYLVATLLAGWEPVVKGIKGLLRKELDMNFLMTIAVAGAFVIGQYSEGAAVAILFAIGEFLESYTMSKTKNALNKMLDLAPKTATLVVNGFEHEKIAVEKIVEGSHILIRPGEGIPLDGLVFSGNSSINQAAITGESMPVFKNIGDVVYAGSLNVNGLLEVETTSTMANTTLAKVKHLVEEAQEKKADFESIVERFARVYTPLVTLGAIMAVIIPTLIFKQSFDIWFYRALVLLVIACPCALVISTPVAVVAAIGNAAKKGILVKGGTFLEAFANIKIVAFDKTGTLTLGKLMVKEVRADFPDEMLRLAASVETGVNHPLASAVVDFAKAKGISIGKISEFINYPGLGAKAEVDGKHVLVGNVKFLIQHGINISSEENENSIIAVACENKFLGTIYLEDEERQEGPKVVKQLADAGIQSVMLTGDNVNIAQVLAKKVGINEYYASLLPEDKLKIIKELKIKGTVAMVGDGINDAPALAEADIGMAMGKVGSDIAMETADIVLMHDDLKSLPELSKLSKRMVRTIKINIAIAVGVKAFFVILTIFGYSNLWMAVFADTGTLMLVTAYSMRLIK